MLKLEFFKYLNLFIHVQWRVYIAFYSNKIATICTILCLVTLVVVVGEVFII